MNELLYIPAIQAGVLPFLVAFTIAWLLAQSRFIGVAVAAGYLIVISLVVGFSLEPMTSVRKMVLLGAGACLASLLLELGRARPSHRLRAGMALVLMFASLWVVQRLLLQKEGLILVMASAGTALFVALLVDFNLLRGGDDNVHASASGLMGGLCAGGLAWMGASAMLAQIGIALAAASGATLLVQMLGGQRSSAWTLSLPASVVTGTLLVLVVFGGELPWYSLLPVLVIPWAPGCVPVARRALWRTAILASLAALVPALLALGLGWAGRSVAAPI